MRTGASLVPPRLDIAVAAFFVLLAVAEAVVSRSVASPQAHVALTGVALATLAWRRRFPVLVAVVVVWSNLLSNPEGEFSVLLALVLACFTIGAETDPPRSYVGLGVVLVPFLGAMVYAGLEPSDLAATAVFVIGPWIVGALLRQRSASTSEALLRADRLEREQEMRASLAAAEERTRIARELHDIVSHSISVVAIQTQAVRRRLGPEHAAEAADLAMVEATAREALAEMRRLFGVLRDDGESASLTPQPGLSELRRLVERLDGEDLAVTLTVEGTPYDLPPGLDLAAYRIAQEGLTNAARHSGAGAVTVTVRYGEQHVVVEVRDDGRGLSTRADGGNGTAGHGLLGLRERVAMYDGTLEVADGPGGGVRLVARLPVGEGVS